MPKIITRAEAKALGLKRYFTGVPCPHGHVCQRLVSEAKCIDCSNQKRTRNLRRQWARDPALMRERKRERWRAAHPKAARPKAAHPKKRSNGPLGRARSLELKRIWQRHARVANIEAERERERKSKATYRFMQSILLKMGLIKKEDTEAEQRGLVVAYAKLGLINREEIEVWLNTKKLKKA
jgi:hypothetical protein